MALCSVLVKMVGALALIMAWYPYHGLSSKVLHLPLARPISPLHLREGVAGETGASMPCSPCPLLSLQGPGLFGGGQTPCRFIW
jgi:hypothetical protein